MRRRLTAVAALVAGVAAVVAAAVEAVRHFPRGFVVLACIALALWLGAYAITRHGARRAAGLAVAVLLLVVPVVLLVGRDPLVTVGVIAASVVSVTLAREAFRSRVELPPVPPPQHAVLFYNPRSGGGKATRYDLPGVARARGIKPVELTAGVDLEELVRSEVAAGADGLAMAGGDGSQAIVAAVAAETGLPYACIPAGTRNHFALDLGVDRDDVVGALEAFVDGGERVVDLAEVDGRVFVNNVSLGLYASAVQSAGYRDAKVRTLLATTPNGRQVTWHGPDGERHGSGLVMLVSNNRYRLGRAIGSGTRPRLDGGELGVVVLGGRGEDGADRSHHGWREWTAPSLQVDGEDGRPIAAGIDGEAVQLGPHPQFRVRPGTLRVRIARHHPGASPSAMHPDGAWDAVRGLVRIALDGSQPYDPAS